MQPNTILSFWFDEIDAKQWWRKDASLDALVGARFGAIHQAARAGELFAWRDSAQGRLAEILVLDQFSRNIYREQSESFAGDPQALVLAQEAIGCGVMDQLPVKKSSFILMPIMHSESLPIHDAFAAWMARPGFETTLASERRHRGILLRFGRYPHRNAILGRDSTAEEAAFLLEPGSAF